MRLSRFPFAVSALLTIRMLSGQVAIPSTSNQQSVVMQLPPDQQAFKSARGIADPRQRLEAMEAFLRDYPYSSRVASARYAAIDLLIHVEPRNINRIHSLLSDQIASSDRIDRAWRKGDAAHILAYAGPNGIDLTTAETWARDAVANSTLAIVSARLKANYAKFGRTAPSDAVIKKLWAEQRAQYLETLAVVYFDQGSAVKAARLLNEAGSLDPNNSEIYALEGEIAHQRHEDAVAIDKLEKAEVLGNVSPSQRKLLDTLYVGEHHGQGATLEAELDRQYRSLPKGFAAVRPAVSKGKRAVFVEMYTGSGCGPCAAVDLGVDAVLQAYPRKDVVALSFDLHIPHPDPLANADTSARADAVGVHYTPVFRIDGKTINAGGGDRSHGKEVFDALIPAIDAELESPSGVELELHAELESGSMISTTANVVISDPQELKQFLRKDSEALSDKEASDQPAPRLVLNFALVQPTVRYGGENGIRFHSMIVRALSESAIDEFQVSATGSVTASHVFDTSAISIGLYRYLSNYETHNETFGTAHFLSKDTRLPLDDLAIAAWVEDSAMHRVVAVAYVPLLPGKKGISG